MKKPSRARLLLKLLPAAISISGAVTHAIALEAPGTVIVSKLGDALQSGYLHDAQALVDLMFKCDVKAISIGDVTITMQQLHLLITDLASNDRTAWENFEAAFNSIGSGVGATLIGARTFVPDEGCDDPQTFPPGSQSLT